MTGELRDRVVELRRVPAVELMDNEKNWRVHPYAQRRAVAESLQLVGIADVLIAYHSQRNGGRLTLIDGHDRRSEFDVEWPTVILDVDDEEADLLLLTLDPMVGMAEADGEKLRALVEEQRPKIGTVALEDLLHTLRDEAEAWSEELEEIAEDAPLKTLPEMELQPYEHYDYVVLLCRNTYDWMGLCDALGIEQVAFTAPNESRRFGLGRVVDAARVLELLRKRE